MDWEKLENMWVMMTYNLAGIRSGSFPNTGLDRYRYMNLSDYGFARNIQQSFLQILFF
jgi:hypothetical protein